MFKGYNGGPLINPLARIQKAVTWQLDYGTAVGGEWDEVVGGTTYQGYIWPSDGAGLRYAVEDEDDAKAIVELLNDRGRIEQLARDLLAWLSRDYGDSEDCPAEIEELFSRGEKLLPIK